MKQELKIGKEWFLLSLVPYRIPVNALKVLEKAGVTIDNKTRICRYSFRYNNDEVIFTFLSSPVFDVCYACRWKAHWEVCLPAPRKGKRHSSVQALVWKIHCSFLQSKEWPWTPKETQKIIDYFWGKKPEETHKPYFD